MSIAPQQQTLTAESTRLHFISAWLVGIVAAYFLTSFFSNFYPLTYQFIVLTLFFQALAGLGLFLFFSPAQNVQAEEDHDWSSLLPFLIALLLSISAAFISWQFPGLFHRQILFMDSSRLPIFILLSLVSLEVSAILLRTTIWVPFSEWLKETQFFVSVHEHWQGILLASFFLFTYFVFAESINFPQFRTLDEYFDTDISVWLQRLTVPAGQDVTMVRAVHPAVLIFLRPVVWFLSLFLHGNRLQAVFVMHALAGAACVLLTWLIVKGASGNTNYSLIVASLLGTSAAHLLLSSMLETYIYSALALLLFIYLLQREKTALKFTVPVGILIFGITVTNLIQSSILYFFKHPRIKVLIKYVVIVVLITTLLNVLQVWLYPQAQAFFRPSSMLYEQRYVFDPFNFSWRAMGRSLLMIRGVILYGMVAPTPFILTKEIGSVVPNFRTYQILLGQFHVAGYRGLGDVTVKFWIVILEIAGIVFILDFFKSPKQMLFPLSLLLCLGFSLALHLVYGDDPVLYSPDWAYALVLFVAISLQKWADRRWLQLALLVFLIILMISNLQLIHKILEASAPFYSTLN